jgi:hypothetical protein
MSFSTYNIQQLDLPRCYPFHDVLSELNFEAGGISRAHFSCDPIRAAAAPPEFLFSVVVSCSPSSDLTLRRRADDNVRFRFHASQIH